MGGGGGGGRGGETGEGVHAVQAGLSCPLPPTLDFGEAVQLTNMYYSVTNIYSPWHWNIKLMVKYLQLALEY